MSAQLQCLECKEIFAESEAERIVAREPYEFWGKRGQYTRIILECPRCGGTEVDDAQV